MRAPRTRQGALVWVRTVHTIAFAPPQRMQRAHAGKAPNSTDQVLKDFGMDRDHTRGKCGPPPPPPCSHTATQSSNSSTSAPVGSLDGVEEAFKERLAAEPEGLEACLASVDGMTEQTCAYASYARTQDPIHQLLHPILGRGGRVFPHQNPLSTRPWPPRHHRHVTPWHAAAEQ